MSKVPGKIGKYEIVEEVGRGSMGTVFSAHDPFSDRLVAIKLAHPQFVDNLQEGESFGEMGYLLRAKRTASVVARTDASLMKVNASSIDRAAESTQLRFHKVFVRTLIARLTDTTNLLAQVNSA